MALWKQETVEAEGPSHFLPDAGHKPQESTLWILPPFYPEDLPLTLGLRTVTQMPRKI
jgi:hypothetical protein